MTKLEVRPGIYWVGAIDWDIRNFHGYIVNRGTTYNAFLIIDEKVVLVDTVKHYMYDEMLERIKEIIDPAKIDIVLSNHVEMDHSGSLPKIMELIPNAKIITSVQGEKGLRRHFKKDWNFIVVKSGESMKIGKRTLVFVHTPMVHWPDSMVTYCPEEKILFSSDAFGQHIATAERWDDEIGWDVLREEAGRYYANIVLPYADQTKKALDALAGLKIDMILPDHGAMWRSLIPKILEEYGKWATNQTVKRALIVYDSMWESTEKMAYSLREGLLDGGIPVTLMNLKVSHISDVVAEALTAKGIFIGSSTLNGGLLPTVAAFLTYIKGLRPKNRVGHAFGSFGWSGQAVGDIEKVIKEMGWETPVESINLKYVPDPEELAKVREAGRALAESLKQ